jgi:hypothetical protein
MDTGLTVGSGRTFEEYKFRSSFSISDAFIGDILVFPIIPHIFLKICRPFL